MSQEEPQGGQAGQEAASAALRRLALTDDQETELWWCIHVSMPQTRKRPAARRLKPIH